MLRIVYQFSFFFMAVFLAVFGQAAPCQANEVSVELVWKLGQTGWAEINVVEGSYKLIVEKTIHEFPAGSTLQVGWGGWTPVLCLNHGDFQVLGQSGVELKGVNPGSLRVKTPNGQDIDYRGGLKLNWQDNHWRIINTVDSEDYLRGVVPIEMSNSWAQGGIESLKAQAVAARTFLVKHTEYGKKTITDSPDIDQAYAGKSVEGEASAAIEATRGEILVDAQSSYPIEALYSSHSGGYSEDAKNVWGNTDSHNVSHPDHFSVGVGGAAAHWRFIVSAPLLGSTFGLGPVRNLKLDKFPSGRVKSVRMEDRFGQTKIVTGRTFVKAFYPFGQPIQSTAFLGSLFKAQMIPTSQDLTDNLGFPLFLGTKRTSLPKELQKDQGPLLARIRSSSLGVSADSQPYGVVLFEGSGWGHGVGMSQWGAYHMAQLGYNYKEILLFYYYNTRIQPVEEVNF
jgi:SpoIID/LytB domain